MLASDASTCFCSINLREAEKGATRALLCWSSYHLREEQERGRGRIRQMGWEGDLTEAKGDEKTTQRTSSCRRSLVPFSCYKMGPGGRMHTHSRHACAHTQIQAPTKQLTDAELLHEVLAISLTPFGGHCCSGCTVTHVT